MKVICIIMIALWANCKIFREIGKTLFYLLLTQTLLSYITTQPSKKKLSQFTVLISQGIHCRLFTSNDPEFITVNLQAGQNQHAICSHYSTLISHGPLGRILLQIKTIFTQVIFYGIRILIYNFMSKLALVLGGLTYIYIFRVRDTVRPKVSRLIIWQLCVIFKNIFLLEIIYSWNSWSFTKWIGYFRVTLCFCFKTRTRAKPFLWKWVAWTWTRRGDTFSNDWFRTRLVFTQAKGNSEMISRR